MALLNNVILIALIPFFLFELQKPEADDRSVKVEYTVERNIDHIANQIPDNASKELIIKKLKEPKFYILETNGENSVYYMNASSTSDTVLNESRKENQSNRQIVKISDYNAGKSPKTFKDFLRKEISVQYNVEDQDYVVTNTFTENNWEIAESTETIAGMICYRATLEDKSEPVTAWFTTEIPLSDGPASYFGLPGLVLKVESKNSIIYANKISFPDTLNIPAKKGRSVTQEQFTEIRSKSLEEYTNKKTQDGNRTSTSTRKVIKLN